MGKSATNEAKAVGETVCNNSAMEWGEISLSVQQFQEGGTVVAISVPCYMWGCWV